MRVRHGDFDRPETLDNAFESAERLLIISTRAPGNERRFAQARNAIEAGTMAASVAQLPSEMGRIAVESAVRIIRGETIPAEQLVPIELVRKTGATGAAAK